MGKDKIDKDMCSVPVGPDCNQSKLNNADNVTSLQSSFNMTHSLNDNVMKAVSKQKVTKSYSNNMLTTESSITDTNYTDGIGFNVMHSTEHQWQGYVSSHNYDSARIDTQQDAPIRQGEAHRMRNDATNNTSGTHCVHSSLSNINSSDENSLLCGLLYRSWADLFYSAVSSNIML